MSRFNTVSLFTTGRCNLNCPHCSQEPFRAAFADVDMPLAVVDAVIAGLERFPGRDWRVHLTGGEPTLWTVATEACERLRASRVVKHVRVYSNCLAPRVLDALLEARLIDCVYTDLGNCHRNNLAGLIERWGEKAGVSDKTGRIMVAGKGRSGHRVLPTGPLDGSLPALCQCPKVAVLPDGQVFPCGNLFSVTRRYGLPVPTFATSRLDERWIAAMDMVAETRFDMDACRYCSANKHVWDTLEDAPR